MARNFIKRCRTLAKNVVSHGKFVTSGEEKPGEALRRIGQDVRKLGRGQKTRDSNEVQRTVRERTQQGADLYNTKHYREAEEALKEAILLDDQYPRAYSYLGHVFLKQDRYDEAKQAFKTAIKLDPKCPVARKARKKLKEVALKRSLDDLNDMDDLD